jgi:septum formation protein
VGLVLASASPRRAELLRAAGFAFDVHAVAVDETARAAEPPDAYVQRVASDKSWLAQQSLAPHLSGDPVVLAADTTVVVDGEMLGKPRDAAEAERMLRRLSGRRHDVLTGVSLRRGGAECRRVESTAVFMALLTDEEVSWYVAQGEGLDKAGGYAIQGRASRFVSRIEGSYTNVVGLPIAAVHELLAQLGGP